MEQEMMVQGQSVRELRQGAARLVAAPQCGARLLWWEVAGERLMYWPEEADWSRLGGVRGGNPLLFPFLGRQFVEGAMGYWRHADGTRYPLPLHGFARDLPFAVTECTANRLRMLLRDTHSTLAVYPFAFEFEVLYTLEDAALEVALTVRNTGDEALPYYAGHHFYFSVPHDRRNAWEVNIPARQWCRQNPDGSIEPADAKSANTTLDDPELRDRMHTDLSAPLVTLQGPERRFNIRLDCPESLPWYAVTTWTEKPESDFYCVEPWLGLPNAIHHGQGLRRVEPGAGETAICRIEIA